MLFTQLMVNLRIVLFIILLNFNGSAVALLIGTYNTPPFSMYEDGAQIGLATEIITQLLKEAKISDYKIVNYPLMRGLIELNHGRVEIFYPYILGTEHDNQTGTLIGPISKYQLGLFVRADNNIQISLASMQPHPVAAERGGLGNRLLEKDGFKLELTSDKTSCLTMVLGRRVTSCAVGVLPGMYLAALNNMYAKLRFVITDLSADMYLLVGPSVAPEIVLALQEAYGTLQKQDYFAIKQADYEKKFKTFIETMR